MVIQATKCKMASHKPLDTMETQPHTESSIFCGDSIFSYKCNIRVISYGKMVLDCTTSSGDGIAGSKRL